MLRTVINNPLVLKSKLLPNV